MSNLNKMGSRLANVRIPTWSKYVIFVGVVGFLIRQISVIGWKEVLNSLPSNPLFYLILVVLLFSLPIAEVFIYKISWRFKGYSILGMLIKKRVLNREVMGYSGEVLAYGWGKSHLDLSDSDILKTIRDNNIISSASSTLVAIGLILFFVIFGELSLAAFLGNPDMIYVVGVLIVITVVGFVAYRYRRLWFSMDSSMVLSVAAIYVGRQLIGMALQIAQWAVALPEVGLTTWFTFGAASMILSRIPLIPNKDLIFVSAGIGLAGVMDISQASVAGMLLVISALRRLIHFSLFTTISIWEKASPQKSVTGSVPIEPEDPDERIPVEPHELE